MFFAKKKTVEQEEAKKPLYENDLVREQLRFISNIPLDQEVELSQLNVTKKCMQIIYKEIKLSGFHLRFVDYLCWISTSHIAGIIKKRLVKIDDIHAVITELYLGFYEIRNYDIRNTLRLFHSDDRYFMDALGIQNPEERKKLFLQIMEVWYDIKQAEKTK